MSLSLQEFLATATTKAAIDLEAAFLQLPPEKRNAKLAEGARSAADQVAECALMHQSTVEMLDQGRFPSDFAYLHYAHEISLLVENEPALLALLQENTARIVAVIRALPQEKLETEIESPWGPVPVVELISYPYWNLTYHLGQLNFIASLSAPPPHNEDTAAGSTQNIA